jgi:hypothetical protein
VSDGDLLEIYPIKGEKPSYEAKTAKTASSQSAPCQAASGRRSGKWKDSHRGHRGHQDPAGVNRVGRRPVGKKERRKEDSQSEPFWAASARRVKYRKERKVTKTIKYTPV